MTENYFLINSLEDLIHGVMMGDNVLKFDSGLNERLWKSLYNKLMDKHDREAARSMIKQVESNLRKFCKSPIFSGYSYK